MKPFIIYALPRSRTAWLAKFLSYREWTCHHEAAIRMRSMDEVRALFAQPHTGFAETAAAQGRPLIHHAAPQVKEVVVLRPVDEVVESVLNVNVSGVAVYDRTMLKRNMEYGDRELRKIAKDPKVLSVDYAELDREETCARIFEHCLPYPFDRKWWELLKDVNIQTDVKAVLLYYQRNRDAVETFKKHCKNELRRLMRAGELERVRYA